MLNSNNISDTTLQSSAALPAYNHKPPISPYLCLEKIQKIIKSLFPLTLPYQDDYKHTIQVWSCANYPLFATICDEQGNLKIISAKRIHNPLNLQESSLELLPRLKSIGLRLWQLSYREIENDLFIWPFLIAAGKEPKPNSPLHESVLQKGTFKDSSSNVNTANKMKVAYELKQAKILTAWGVLTPRAIKTSKDIPLAGPLNNPAVIKELTKDGSKIEDWQKMKTPSFKLKNGNKVQVHYYQNKLTGKINRNIDYKVKGNVDPNQHPPEKPTPPNQKNLGEKLNQNKLTQGYNAQNPGKPVKEQGGGGGSIGGVGNDVGLIHGLFDTYNSHLEYEHFFYIPSVDGKAPFTNNELQQILRELAIGIYLHDTIPFFSLHFNGDSNMNPVIHPAYQNTLVGRVMLMIVHEGKSCKLIDFADRAGNTPLLVRI